MIHISVYNLVWGTHHKTEVMGGRVAKVYDFWTIGVGSFPDITSRHMKTQPIQPGP